MLVSPILIVPTMTTRVVAAPLRLEAGAMAPDCAAWTLIG
jgi:hypothetical protein